jgi:hypothetical protein
MPIIRLAYIAYRFLKEALHRVAGMDREASVATTVFTLGMVAAACEPFVEPGRRRLRKPSPPSRASGAIGLVLVRHMARRIGGDALKDTPYAAAIISLAMVRPAWQLMLLPVRAAEAAMAQLRRFWRYVTVGARRGARAL